MQKDCHVSRQPPETLVQLHAHRHMQAHACAEHSKSRQLHLQRESLAHAGLYQCMSVLIGQDVPHRYR